MVISPIRIKATDLSPPYMELSENIYTTTKLALDELEQVMLTGVGSAYIDERIYGLPTSEERKSLLPMDSVHDTKASLSV